MSGGRAKEAHMHVVNTNTWPGKMASGPGALSRKTKNPLGHFVNV